MKTIPRKGKAAFTLIEMMAVVTIIAILAGLVVGGLGYVSDKQATSAAKVQIALISKALEDYKSDMGQYPPTANSTNGSGNSADALYSALFYEGYDYSKQATPPATWIKQVNGVDVPKSTKVYLAELDPTSSKQGWVDAGTGAPPTSATVKDPWGKEYLYRSAMGPLPPPPGSAPSNAATQNPDFDLWSAGKDGKSTANPSDKENRDDIKNF